MMDIKEKFRTLKVQLYLGYFVTFVLLSVLMVLVIFLGVKRMITDQIGLSRVEVLNQISERSNTIKNSTLTISSLYRYDRVVKGQLGAEEGVNGEAYLEQLKMNYGKVFQDVGISYETVILGENGFRYSSADGPAYNFSGLEKQLWFKKAYHSKEEIVFISSFKDSFHKKGGREDPYVFSALRKVTDWEGCTLGAIMVNVDEKYLERLYASILDGKSNIYIFDSEGKIVSSREKSLLGVSYIGVDNFKNLYGKKQYHIIKKLGQDYLLSYCYDDQTEWTIVEEVPCKVIFSPLNNIVKLLMAALGICMVFAVVVSYYLAARISKPITQLCWSMDQVRQGDFDATSKVKGYQEAKQLGHSFNEMAGEIKNLMENIKQREITKKRIEMDFLRAQINPHFLYNTLFSIQCMIEIGKNDQAVQMMTAFINLLKRTLSVDADFVTLREEFESTEKYLVLQQIRDRNQIDFECELEPEAEGCLVPSLIIQPIVENAIFHGLDAKEGGGFIIVEAGREEDRLQITVSDDGEGLSTEEMAQLKKRLESSEYHRGKSIGLINVSNRIRMNFGEEYGIEITSQQGVGTTVTLIMPVMLKESGQQGEKE